MMSCCIDKHLFGRLRVLVTAAVSALAVSTGVTGQEINVSITNEGNSDFFLTPLWFALHDGSFDVFNAGEAASMSLESIAEEGVVAGLQSDIMGVGMDELAANAMGFGGAPVIDPGETATGSVMVADGASYRYLSYASMVIPSNDSFIGNEDPMAYEVFDASGNFNGPLTIQIFGNQVWDAGTEVNSTMGAAFSTVGGDGADEGGVVALLGDGGLDNFENTGTVAGSDIMNLLGGTELLATIQVTQVPEPGSFALICLGAVALGMVRRRRG